MDVAKALPGMVNIHLMFFFLIPVVHYYPEGSMATAWLNDIYGPYSQYEEANQYQPYPRRHRTKGRAAWACRHLASRVL
jgi:hypothetical protein